MAGAENGPEMGTDTKTVDPVVQQQLVNSQAQSTDRSDQVKRIGRQVAIFAIFVVALAALYTGYKALAISLDNGQTDWPIIGGLIPRGDDLNMPPIGDIVGAFGDTPRGSEGTYTTALFGEGLFTLREAAVGFAVGLVVGLSIAIAIALARWRWLDRGLLPYVIASQTVPLVAIAPIVVIWGRNSFDFLPWQWQDWMSVSIIAAYLTFFPVAVNGLRGLQSPESQDLELMDSYASSWLQTLWRLRLPASVPYLFAALKIAATASIVGAIVGEISAGVSGGLGRRLLSEALNYTTGPERLYASVIGAAVLGIAVFLIVTGTERLVLSRQNREAL